ncbi:hypothetical protein EVAR_35371_1 [Eumeta japonica]|uniref:Uncharacterized protein n=1 Tax=Eumeta variegata TaxID=151549 RepID=A0A4C2A5A5_EUMVA|nr:hypothetical protein EVAR_35371_1 [Eumeta japonica]
MVDVATKSIHVYGSRTHVAPVMVEARLEKISKASVDLFIKTHFRRRPRRGAAGGGEFNSDGFRLNSFDADYRIHTFRTMDENRVWKGPIRDRLRIAGFSDTQL